MLIIPYLCSLTTACIHTLKLLSKLGKFLLFSEIPSIVGFYPIIEKGDIRLAHLLRKDEERRKGGEIAQLTFVTKINKLTFVDKKNPITEKMLKKCVKECCS